MTCTDRQLTQAELEAAFEQQRTGVQKTIRPFSGQATPENIVDYLNREVFPVLKASRDAINEVFTQVVDNASSANPLRYLFSSSTVNADPTNGFLRLDNATQNLSTTIRVSQLNARLVDATPWLEVMAGSSTSPLGVVTLQHARDPGRFIRFDLNTMTDQGAYWDLSVSVVESSGDNPFTENDPGITIGFIAGVASGGTTVSPSAITPIADDTFLANIAGAVASPAAVALTTLAGDGIQGGANAVLNIDVSDFAGTGLEDDGAENLRIAAAAAGAGLTGGGGSALAVGAGTRITVNADDVQLASGAAETFLGNFTAGVAVADYRAGSSVAGAGLTYTAGGTLAVGAATNVTVNANDVAVTNFPLTGLATQADDTFLANISGGAAAPAAVALTTMAGAGLTGGSNAVLAVGAGDGIDVNADDVAVDVTDIVDNVSITEVATNNIQRAALTGFAAASAGSNATTSAEPIVTYSSSANMSAERVTTSSTSVTVSTGVASQIEFQRAAITGEVTIAANANAATVTRSTDFQTTPWTGNHEFTGNVRLNGTFEVRGRSDATLAADADDFDMTTFNVARLVGNDFRLTGMVPNGTNGQTVQILNADSGDSLIIGHEDTGSTAANRFVCPGGVDFHLQPRSGVWARYDDTADRWFLLDRGPNNKILTPAQITANQNDYTPTDWETANIIRLSSDTAGRLITGAAAGFSGEQKLLINTNSVASARSIFLTIEDASSTAANRFLTSSTGLNIAAGGVVAIVYDGTSSRWRPVSQF